jgi:hypothetical protein
MDADIDKYLKQSADLGDSAHPDLDNVDKANLGEEPSIVDSPITPTPKTKGKPGRKEAKEPEITADTNDSIDISDTMTIEEIVALGEQLTEAMKNDPYLKYIQDKQKMLEKAEKRAKNADFEGDPPWVRDMKYKPSDEEIEDEIFNEQIGDPEEPEEDYDEDTELFPQMAREYTRDPKIFAGLVRGDASVLGQKDIDGFKSFIDKNYPMTSDGRLKNIHTYVSDLREKVIKRVVSDTRMKNIVGALKGRVI